MTFAPPRVDPVVIEHHRSALGIGENAPRLSWTTQTSRPGWRQAAYEIEIGGQRSFSTGRVDSADQVLVPWPDLPLRSRERCTVRVRVWGHGEDVASEWSEETPLEAGLLDPQLWTAAMISPPVPRAGEGGEPAMLLRAEFSVPDSIASARIRATALGVMTLRLNGRAVGDDVLHPGWTSYASRLRYRTWDVTDNVQAGANALALELADGWYRGYLGFGGLRELYGERTAALVQLEIAHHDGSMTIIGTDETWKAAPSPTARADLYMGETFDARAAAELEQTGRGDLGGYDDSTWSPVRAVPFDPTTLTAPTGPPVRVIESLSPEAVFTSPSGRTIIDFGQNLVGRLRLRIPAGRGTITLRHAEVLEDGELGTRPLRKALATDEVILDGAPLTWEPSFTFHGFRYAEVSGWPGALDPADIDALVIHTDMAPSGDFACSDPLLTRLHENARWSMRGNFLDIPTDCPQRDERLGWTGDLAVFAPTAAFLYDVSGMLSEWLADLALEQHPDGNVPPFVPWVDADPNLPPLGPEAGWGDAATIVPWTLYQRTGDLGLLRRQWTSMTAWVDAFAGRAGEGIDFPAGGFSFGDWLDAGAADDRPWDARLPWQAVATAYLAQSAGIVRDAARLLGEDAAEEHYGKLRERAAERYRNEYMTPSGRSAFASQTAYALALRFDLLAASQREHAGQLLAEQVAADGFHIGAGFLGTGHVCDALVDAGQSDTAWRLLLQRECPSWLFPVTMGATTIWERWNSMLPDGSINPGEMTSFNHYAFGSIADFLHRRVAGLAPAEPGYRRLRIAPVPTPDLDWARASHETPYGRAETQWTLGPDGTFTLRLVIPPSTSAEVLLPDGSAHEVAAGEHEFSCTLPAGP
ncbi:family 78 glycoside hydrolase catalytic domain [Brevibacterium oceani]|uniref:family 78 glycoside hydrolase catalytic domain n=1 Tax=Brevibacterium oceani TaxID=358099 RepID=UPI0015E6FC33|nr:family 78 glycoside hydrolase catalytic domain [Brevibacterium oceani]